MNICWRTRKKGDSPRGKAKVYFSCCDSAFEKFSDKIFDQIFDICDCAIYYYPPKSDVATDDEYRFNLKQMDLFVIPVTTELLCTQNRTINFDLAFAIEHNIPILPLVQENNIETGYKQKFGNIQFLKESDNDHTALPYMEKLGNFLKSILANDALVDEVRKAFYAKIFLSYRKKDREYAQAIMSLIHEHKMLENVAIWYDEFLVPGDDFEKNIRNILSESDLFLLAVTPNVLEKPNYVMDEEYPAANNVIPIVPAELVPTDITDLKKYYPGISDPIDAYDERARSGALLNLLSARLEREDTSHHRYLMGIAYLRGIDVEKNPTKAVALLEIAANENVAEAAEELSKIYNRGDQVSKDYEESQKWARRSINITKESLEANQDEDSYFNHYTALLLAGMICEENSDNISALDYYQQMIPISHKLCDQFDCSKELLSDSYRNVGRVYSELNKLAEAVQYRRKAVEFGSLLYDEERSMKTRWHLVTLYCELSESLEQTENYNEAAYSLIKAIDFLEIIMKAQNNDGPALKMIDLCDTIGRYFKVLGDSKKARLYIKRADKIFKEKNFAHAKDDDNYLMLSHYFFSRGKTIKAIKQMRKAINSVTVKLKKEKNIHSQKLLGCMYSMMGTLFESLWLTGKSKRYQELSLEIFRNIASEYPSAQTYYDLIEQYATLASCYDSTENGDPDDALYGGYIMTAKEKRDLKVAHSYYSSALQLYNKVDEKEAPYLDKKVKIEILDAIGRISKVLGKKEEAACYYQEHLDLCVELCEEMQSDTSYARVAASCYKLAMVTLERDLMESALEIWTELSEKYPDDKTYKKKKKEAITILKS